MAVERRDTTGICVSDDSHPGRGWPRCPRCGVGFGLGRFPAGSAGILPGCGTICRFLPVVSWGSTTVIADAPPGGMRPSLPQLKSEIPILNEEFVNLL